MKQKPKLINIVNQAKNKNNRDLIKQMQRPKDKMSIVLASGKFIQTIQKAIQFGQKKAMNNISKADKSSL